MTITKTITALCAVCASLTAYAQDAHAYQWPDSIYACVNNADYLTQDEKQVVIEINKARTNPVQYALNPCQCCIRSSILHWPPRTYAMISDPKV